MQVAVDVDVLNIRTGPATTYRVDHTEKRGKVFEVNPTNIVAGFASVGTALWAAWEFLKPVPTGTANVTINTDVLNVRSGPGTNYSVVYQLRRGAVVTVNQALTRGNWLRLATADERWISSQYVTTRSSTPDPDPTPQPITGKLWGINIDPMNPAANPSTSTLSGVGWVRFVFHAARGLDQAFAYYDPIIHAYASAGIKTVLILLQDTYWGNGPWDNGNWSAFYPGFADVAGRIAAHYGGQVAAYEIWNEQDIAGQPTSIYIPPANYAALLVTASRAIRQANPAAKVISGGLAGSDPVGYMLQVKTAAGNLSAIDGLGYHPYGKTPPNTAVFDWAKNTLAPNLQAVYSAFKIPVWITEIGVPRVDVNNASLWSVIGNYMRQTFTYVRNVASICPVLIWFAWADSQDNAGIVHDNQQHKGAIWDAFAQNVRDDAANPKSADPVELPPSQPTQSQSLHYPHILGDVGSNTSKLYDLIANGNMKYLKLVKNGWDSQLTVAQVHQIDPTVKVVVRRYDKAWENRVGDLSAGKSLPDGFWNQPDMRQIGYDWVMEYYRRFIQGEPDTQGAAYHQVICEPDYGKGTATFWEGAFDAAKHLNIKLVYLCFSSGRPSLISENKPDSYIWASLFNTMRRGWAEGHIAGVDCYVSKLTNHDWSEDWELHRWKRIYAEFPSDLKRMPMMMLEFGDEKSLSGGAEKWLANLRIADDIMIGSPIEATFLWTGGDGGDGDWTPDRIDSAYPQLRDYRRSR